MLRRWVPSYALLLLSLLAPQARAADSATPWLFSQKPLVVARIEQPAAAAGHFLRLVQLPELQAFPTYRELLNSTGQKRFQQLIGYLCKELACTPAELLDKLAGGGIAFALEPQLPNPFINLEPQACLVISGRDETFMQKATDLLVQIGTQELARQDQPEKYSYETFRGTKITKLDGRFALAVVGRHLLVSNKVQAIKALIVRAAQPEAEPAAVSKARQQVASSALGWLWVDLKQVKGYADANFKKTIELPTNEFFPHIVVGGWFDVIRRSDEVLVALKAEGEDLVLTTTLPAGQEGMSEVMKSVFALPQDGPGLPNAVSLPGTLFESTFVFHPHGFIKYLDGFVTKKVAEEFREFEKNARPVLLGRKFSDLVGLIGRRHQFLIVHQRDTGYKLPARDPQPSYGLVLELTDGAKFDQQALPLVRAAGLLTSFNVSMKLVEEKVGEHTILGYRFTENDKNKAVANGLLFNFSPSICRIGNRLIVSSSLELARDLVPVVLKDSQTPTTDLASSRYRFSWPGLNYLVAGNKEAVKSQIILNDGSSPEEVEQQLADLEKLLHRLGVIEAAVYYGKNEFRLEMRTRMNATTAAKR